MSDKSHTAAQNATLSPKQPQAKLADNQMHCPCCGNVKLIETKTCDGCGARPVADGMAKALITLPKLGPAMAALGLTALLIIGFLAFWIIGNDMKVGRALLVNVFGESFEFTRKLLAADNHLDRYRIFTWDAYRNSFNASFVIVPLALLAMRMAWRAWRNAKLAPAEFGGLRMARVSFALSSILAVAFGVACLSQIPNVLQRGRDRHLAATRAAMYEHASALRAYNREHGTYPQESVELKESQLPVGDYWENEFKYEPFGTVASSRADASGFSSFTLRSAGPDGVLGNWDDIVMVDGVIVDSPAEADLPPSLLAPEKPRKK